MRSCGLWIVEELNARVFTFALNTRAISDRDRVMRQQAGMITSRHWYRMTSRARCRSTGQSPSSWRSVPAVKYVWLKLWRNFSGSPIDRSLVTA